MTWGAPKIHGELLELGIDVRERTVSRFMWLKPPKTQSQTWRAFLDNYWDSMASIDFFAVPAATFRVLYLFLVLFHDRRRYRLPSRIVVVESVNVAFAAGENEDTRKEYGPTRDN